MQIGSKEWFKIQDRILNALRAGDAEGLKSILEETGFDINSIMPERLFHWTSMSGNLAVLNELMILGVPPLLNRAGESLGNIIGVHFNFDGQMTYRYLKIFLYLMTRPTAFEFYERPWYGKTEGLQKIKDYLTAPANRETLVRALAEVHRYVPLVNAEAKPIRDYLVSIGVENTPELIAEAISATSFERRAHLLAFRRDAIAKRLAEWEAIHGSGAGSGSAGGRRRTMRKHKRGRRRTGRR